MRRAFAAPLLRGGVKRRDVVPDRLTGRPVGCVSQCCVIPEGFSCRYKMLAGSKRQILSFHIAGIPDLQTLEIMDHKVALLPHETMRAFLGAHPRTYFHIKKHAALRADPGGTLPSRSHESDQYAPARATKPL